MKGRKGLNEKFSQPDLLLTCGSWVLGGRWLGERKRRKYKRRRRDMFLRILVPPGVCNQVAALAERLSTDNALVRLLP